MSKEQKTEPTQQQIALARFADDCEATGFKPSHYYRLWPAIEVARAVIAKTGKPPNPL